MKKAFLIIVLIMVVVFSGFSRTFVDSTGRTVDLKTDKIERVAISGPLAQMMVFAIAPEKLVGFSIAIGQDEEQFFPEKYLNLPVLGQLYGTHGELNLESLLAAKPDVIVDLGEPKGTIKEDMQAIQDQTKIPTVHISCYLNNYGEAFEKLGELLGDEDRAAILSDYCSNSYSQVSNIVSKVDKKRCVYLLGDKGLNVIANKSYQAELINFMTNNIATVDNPTSKGTGNEIDMEQLLIWQPDVIFFAPGSVYSKVGSNYLWKAIKAVRNKNYYEVPMGPYNWMGFPPSVQRYLGMFWLAKILYPEDCDFNLYTKVKQYFALFYHYDLTQAKFEELVGNENTNL